MLDKNAICGGVYLIEIRKNSSKEWIPLYIGESKTIIKRCGEHLYNVFNNPLYFGLTEKDINSEEINLRFSVLESIEKK